MSMAKTTQVRGACLERLLMSGLFRRYVECLTVVFFPWVLLTEQEEKGGDWDVDLRVHSRSLPGQGYP